MENPPIPSPAAARRRNGYHSAAHAPEHGNPGDTDYEEQWSVRRGRTLDLAPAQAGLSRSGDLSRIRLWQRWRPADLPRPQDRRAQMEGRALWQRTDSPAA